MKLKNLLNIDAPLNFGHVKTEDIISKLKLNAKS